MVLEHIESRRWRPGDRIPDESDLAESFGCARSTVNRALRELAAAGVLDRKRKGGTRVAIDPARRMFGDIPITRHEVEAAGKTYSADILERLTGALPARLAKRLQVDADTPAHFILTVHKADSQPVLLEHRWVNIEAVPSITDQCFEHISVNEWLIREVTFTSGKLVFQAVNADRLTARQLGVSEGEAVLAGERITRSGRQWITLAELRHAPAYALELSL